MQEQQHFEQNPLKGHVKKFADYMKNHHPTEYSIHGQKNWLRITDDNKDKISNALLQVQNACLPTIRKLRNTRNIAQLQQRLYLKLKKYEDAFNICHVKSLTPNDADYCADQFAQSVNVDFKPILTKILEEY